MRRDAADGRETGLPRPGVECVGARRSQIGDPPDLVPEGIRQAGHAKSGSHCTAVSAIDRSCISLTGAHVPEGPHENPSGLRQRGMDIEIPEHNLLKVLTMPQTALSLIPREELERQLRIPAGGRPWQKLHRERNRPVSSFATSRVPSPTKSSFLRFSGLLKRIRSAGGHHDSGRHRPPSLQHPGELTLMVGERILGDYRVIDHHARVGPEEQQYRGVTSEIRLLY